MNGKKKKKKEWASNSPSTVFIVIQQTDGFFWTFFNTCLSGWTDLETRRSFVSVWIACLHCLRCCTSFGKSPWVPRQGTLQSCLSVVVIRRDGMNTNAVFGETQDGDWIGWDEPIRSKRIPWQPGRSHSFHSSPSSSMRPSFRSVVWKGGCKGL